MTTRYEIKEIDGLVCVFDNLVKRYAPMGVYETAREFCDKLNNGELQGFNMFWTTCDNGQLLL